MTKLPAHLDIIKIEARKKEARLKEEAMGIDTTAQPDKPVLLTGEQLDFFRWFGMTYYGFGELPQKVLQKKGGRSLSDKQVVNFRCPAGLLVRVDARASDEGRTRTQVILMALREYLELHQRNIVVNGQGTERGVYSGGVKK